MFTSMVTDSVTSFRLEGVSFGAGCMRGDGGQTEAGERARCKLRARGTRRLTLSAPRE